MLQTQEHITLMANFERNYKDVRTDKEDRLLWDKSIIYQDGHVNSLFLAYRLGYMLGKISDNLK